MDYGFPDWPGLKAKLSSRLRELRRGDPSEPPLIGLQLVDSHLAEAEELLSGSGRTLDQLIEAAVQSGSETIEPIFRRLTAEELLLCEQADVGGESGWIEQLAAKVADRWLAKLNSTEVPSQLPQLRIVTFNYDRCFDQRFAAALLAELKRLATPNEYRRFVKPRYRRPVVYHPHGVISGVQPSEVQVIGTGPETEGSSLGVSYGNLDAFRTHQGNAKAARWPHLFTVDTFNDTRTVAPAYTGANQAVAQSDQVLILGMSELGQKDHKLQGFTLRHTVFLSNRSGEVDQLILSSKYPKSSIVPLGLHAGPLIASMTE